MKKSMHINESIPITITHESCKREQENSEKKKSKLSWLTMIHGHFPYCDVNKGNNKITVHRAIFQRERQNS